MIASEVLDRYAAGERDFTTPVEFTQVDLSGVDLSGIRLSESYFDYVNLTNANLSGAYLQGARINGYNVFNGANMTGVDLRHAGINGAYLIGVNLENADLSCASITDVNFFGANFSNASLENTLLHCVSFSNNALTENQRSEAKMRGSNLIHNTLKLENSDLEIITRIQKYDSAIPFPYEEEVYTTHSFIWQIPDKEDIEIDDLIKLGKYPSSIQYKITNINYFRYPDNSREEIENQRYNALLEILRDELTDTKIYWLQEYENNGYLCPTSLLDIYLIGKTKSGSFAGIASPNVQWMLEDIRSSSIVFDSIKDKGLR